MEINRKKFDAGRSNWVHGEHEGYTYEAKVFKAPSQFGIPTPRFQDGGNVSKLCVRDQFGQEVYAFDRGQDLATDEGLEAALQIVAALEAVFVGTMDEAAAQWVRDVATEFGFKRGNVAPEDCAADPWDHCRFTVCRVTYEVHDYRLSIVGQE